MDEIKAIFTTCLEDSISTVSAWDAGNGTLLCRYKGGGCVSKHGISLSGGYVLTCEKNKSLLQAWPLNKQHSENKRLIAPGKVNCIAVSPNSNYIALAVDEKVFLYLAVSGKQLGIGSKHHQRINVVKFNPKGSLIFCGGDDGLITVWKLFTSTSKDTNPMYVFSENSLQIIDILFDHGNPLGRMISISKDNSLKVYDLLRGKIILSVLFDTRLSSVALSIDKMTVFIGNEEGSIHEFSFKTPPRSIDYSLQGDERHAVFNGHDGIVSSLACTNYLISGSVDKTVKIWCIESRLCLKTLDMKGPVTNIVLATIGKSCFDFSFKPEAIFHNFVDPRNADSDSDDENGFCKFVKKEHFLKQVTVSETALSFSKSNEDSLKAKVAQLELVNKGLYDFIVNKVLEQNAKRKTPQKMQKKNTSRKNKSL